jgi:hypothetical protein
VEDQSFYSIYLKQNEEFLIGWVHSEENTPSSMKSQGLVMFGLVDYSSGCIVGVYVSNKEDNGHGNFVAMPYEGNRICLYFQSSSDTRHKRCFVDTDKELEILDNLDGEHSLLVGVISKPPKVIQGMAITEYGNQPSYFMLNVEPRPPSDKVKADSKAEHELEYVYRSSPAIHTTTDPDQGKLELRLADKITNNYLMKILNPGIN